MSEYVSIPEQIKERKNTIELTVDVMFVNNILFVISLGKRRYSSKTNRYLIKSPP